MIAKIRSIFFECDSVKRDKLKMCMFRNPFWVNRGFGHDVEFRIRLTLRQRMLCKLFQIKYGVIDECSHK